MESETNRHNLVTEGEQHRANTITQEHYERLDAETLRHNVEVETENNRHNLAVEIETNRHNVVTEDETARHNLASESLQAQSIQAQYAAIAEQRRHNLAQESISETLADSTISKDNAQIVLYGAQSNNQNAQAIRNLEEAEFKNKENAWYTADKIAEYTATYAGASKDLTQSISNVTKSVDQIMDAINVFE